MKPLLYMAALSIFSSSLAAPAQATRIESSSDRQALVRACLSEAQWPVETPSAYVNGSPRQREALHNSYTPGVSAVTKICRAFETAPPSERATLNTECQDQALNDPSRRRPDINAHAARLQHICSALAG